ncbi:MAG: glutamine-hydrolyzing GMP synthase subunit GuaA [Candidatus Thermoplasmatota archaeon]|nr:glutamine-hydrolyzing GMP synthase subunit GuaA [Candidatus Thermoplasmatota archaeon]
MIKPKEFIEEKVQEIKEVDGKAVVGCSGGVDSTVSSVIASKALGDDLLAIYVDTGYMRKNETEEMDSILEEMGVNHKVIDAKEEFYEEMEGVSDPEEKRKIIGNKFIEIFEREAEKFGADYLVQGTIAPDWIESGDENRDTIKSHHNVGGLPEKMGLDLIEPLYDLYKDEVRKVARELGISTAEKQPFPGPGLAIRVIGEATPEKTEIVREACHIVENEIDKAVEEGKMERPWQYFAVLLPVKTVGVQGDKRAYGHTIAIRAVQSSDAMTARFSRIPLDVLDRISTKITNEMKDEVNRVVYDVTNKPPGTIEWE